MIILIGSQKGGCGKSTITVNLSAYLAKLKKDVVLVDADKQSSSANWATERQGKDVKTVNCVQRYGNISETLKDLGKRYEYVICDVSGRDSKELRSALVVSDIVVIPFRASQIDLNTLPMISEVVEDSKLINANLKIYAVLNMVPTNSKVKEEEEAKEFFTEFKSIQLLKTVIYDRKIYRDVMSEGIGVTELALKSESIKKANDEITKFVKEVLNGN